MPVLERIRVEGFKSIRTLDLSVQPLNILIGANGTGKSNFIAIFRLLNEIANRSLSVFVGRAGGADALLYFGRQTTDSLTVEVMLKSEDPKITCLRQVTITRTS